MAAAMHVRETAPLASRIAILAAAYFILAKLGLVAVVIHPSASFVWPPSGLTLAAILIWGYRVWPGAFIGAFLANVTTEGSIATSVGIALGNAFEGVVGAYLVNRFANGRHAFEQAADVLKFAALASFASTAISATFGVTSLALGGYAEWGRYVPIWLNWWLGDMAGSFIVAPPLILWHLNPRVDWAAPRTVEFALLFALTCVVGFVVSRGAFASIIEYRALEVVAYVPLIWAALRFGPREAATTGFFTYAWVASGVLLDAGVSAGGVVGPKIGYGLLAFLTVFLVATNIPTMVLAAAVFQRGRVEEALRRQERSLRQAGETLELRVRERTREIERMNEALRAELEERKRIEERLSIREQQLSDAQKLAYLGSWEWDPATDRLVWSEELYRIFGLRPETFEPSFGGFLDRIHPDDRDAVRAAVEKAVATGEPFELVERIVRPDGSIRVLRSHGGMAVDGAAGRARMLGVCHDVTNRHRDEQRLREYSDQMRILSQRLLEVQEIEKGNLARELHDEVGHLLTALKMSLEPIRSLAESEFARDHVRDAIEIVDRLIRETREISLDLRPPMLDDLGLVSALRWYVDRFSRRAGLKVRFRHHGIDTRLPPAVETACFRVAQEALTNVLRHAGADSIEIDLTRRDGKLRLAIRDDGAGFDVQEAADRAMQAGRMGVLGMRKRADLAGGDIRIDSSPGKGTEITMSLPLAVGGACEGAADREARPS